MADDVTDKAPLKGGRQRANHIQVHRIEVGLWERKHIVEPLMKSAEVINLGKSVEAVGKGAAYVVGAGAIGASAYVLWWTTNKIYGWVGDAEDWWDIQKTKTAVPVPIDATLTQEQQQAASSDIGIFFPFNQIPGLTWLP